jgi:methylenetetrahydrofolate dehydrogenase (NADP+) / methenyltetrahydrofolate cyclohydrolase
MDGRALGEWLKPYLKAHAAELVEQYKCVPALAAILAGNDPASGQYVKNKRRYAEELGFRSQIIRLGADIDALGVRQAIEHLNADSEVTGILLQLPLPASIDVFPLFDAIDPLKDVDAVGGGSITGFYRGEWGRFIPCTPRGILTLLDYYQVPVTGKRAAVIGRSDISGKPAAIILGGRMRNATITWCHRYTADLDEICRASDIIISCAGAELGENRYLISADMVKPGACIVDVGFRRIGPGRFVGDVDFPSVKEIAGWITPNPGGTGPMTVVALMQNLIDAARYRLGLPRANYPI